MGHQKPRRKTNTKHTPTVQPVQKDNPNLRRGNPGNSGGKAGRSGDKPSWLKRFARRMLKHPGTQRSVKAILISKGQNPAFSPIYKELASRGYGAVNQSHDVNLNIKLEDLIEGSYAAAETLPVVGKRKSKPE